MTRLIAYICNNDSLNSVAVEALAPSLDVWPDEKPPGFGFGWIQDGRSLLRTTPKPSDGMPSLTGMLGDIRTRSFVAHVLEPGQQPAPALDLQPFRFRKWVCAHTGEVPEVDDARRELLETIPSFIRTNVKGDSGSEILCHMFLSELHGRSVLEDGRRDPRAAAEALHATMTRLQSEAAIAEFALVAVTERGLLAGAFGSDLFYREQRGLEEKEAPLFAGHSPRPIQHPSFKSVTVTNAPNPDAEGWTKIPDGKVLFVRDWTVEFVG